MRRLWARKGSRGIGLLPIPSSDMFPPQARARPLRPSFRFGRSVPCPFGPLLLPLGAHIGVISRIHRLRQSITVKRVYGKLRRRSCRGRRNTFPRSEAIRPLPVCCTRCAAGPPLGNPWGVAGFLRGGCAATHLSVKAGTRVRPRPLSPIPRPFLIDIPPVLFYTPILKDPVFAGSCLHREGSGPGEIRKTTGSPVPDGFDPRTPLRRGRSDAFPHPLLQRGDFRNYGPCEDPDHDCSRAHEPGGTQSPVGSSGCDSVKTTEGTRQKGWNHRAGFIKPERTRETLKFPDSRLRWNYQGGLSRPGRPVCSPGQEWRRGGKLYGTDRSLSRPKSCCRICANL